MVWGITAIAFLGTVGILAALMYAFAPTEMRVGQRLSRLASAAAVPAFQPKFADRQKEHIRDSLAGIGKLMPAGQTSSQGQGQLQLIRAGYRSPEAVLAMRGVKLTTPVALLFLVFATRLYVVNPYMFPALALVLGYLLPKRLLRSPVQVRQHRPRRSLPPRRDPLSRSRAPYLWYDQSLATAR